MTIVVRVQGQAADPTRLITRIVIHQELARPASCQLWLADPSAEDQALAPGAAITVAADGTVLFEGQLSERQLSFGGSGGRLRQVVWTAHDALHRLRHRWQERTFRDTTAAGVAAALVGTDGLSVAGPRGPRWSQVLQHGQDDLALLEVVAVRAGLTFCLRGRTLHLLGDDTLDPPIVLSEDVDLLECSWSVATPSAGAAVTGWDAGQARTATGVAGRERLNDQAMEDPAQARALAAGIARRRSSQAGHLSGMVTGTPALRVGGAVQVRAAHLPTVPLRLSRVEHRIDDGTWTTSFATREEDPTFGLTDPPLLTIAAVTAVDDPAGSGRVRVSLPACGGIDGGWLPALAPGAGPVAASWPCPASATGWRWCTSTPSAPRAWFSGACGEVPVRRMPGSAAAKSNVTRSVPLKAGRSSSTTPGENCWSRIPGATAWRFRPPARSSIPPAPWSSKPPGVR